MEQKVRPLWRCQEYVPPPKVSPSPIWIQLGDVLWQFPESSGPHYPDYPGAGVFTFLGSNYWLNRTFFLTLDLL